MKTEQTTNSVEEQQKQKQLVEEVNYLFMKYIAKMKLEVESLTDDQIKKRTKALEMENSSYKTETNRLRKEMSKDYI